MHIAQFFDPFPFIPDVEIVESFLLERVGNRFAYRANRCLITFMTTEESPISGSVIRRGKWRVAQVPGGVHHLIRVFCE
jgi:hypothetical protein